MVERKERLEEEFELSAEDEAIHEYEALTDGYLHVTASLIADEIAHLAKARAGVAVDLGSGPGSLVRELAARFPQLVVIGLDISFSMTKLARERAATDKMKNVAFVVADVHHLPFQTRSMQVIVSHGAMHHWRELARALTEVKQVLADKGFVYLSDLKRDTSDELVEEIATLLNENQARAFVNSIKAAYTVEELAASAAAAGLGNLHVEPEAFSRRTIARNIEKLRESPMRGMRQAAINLRMVGGAGTI
ncbi:MAG: class I SAM-dependent methyltransferase [Deltaproteobacteria bacterium]|nr:class I SAM-dependent methyltransferase [Deltaproteobacteria bacterium]